MSKFSFLDNRYDGLSAMEKIRQVERDNLLYEQTEAIKNMSSNNSSYNIMNANSLGFNIFYWWFLTFVIGGIALIICIIADKDYNLGFGNVPYYIYFGTLLLIVLFGFVLKILNTVFRTCKNIKVSITKPDIEKQIRQLQNEWDSLESIVKTEKTRLNSLETKLRISITLEKGNEKEIDKEIIKARNKIIEYENEQIKLENEVERLENKIY